jgi:hypothetical protein
LELTINVIDDAFGLFSLASVLESIVIVVSQFLTLSSSPIIISFLPSSSAASLDSLPESFSDPKVLDSLDQYSSSTSCS